MKCKLGFIAILVCSISFISLVSAVYDIDPGEYLKEFNNADELCTINDAFFYTDSNNKLNFITIYECCNENQCLKIPFDLQNRKELSELNLEETFNINFVRDKIRGGNLVPSNYFLESFDVCSYFSDKLPEQSRSLAVKAADNVEEFTPKNAQKIYRTMRGAGFATGLITEFDIGLFVVGVGCNKLSKQEDEAFFKVAECYNYVQNIESGTAHYGITSQAYSCMQDADVLLFQVLESWGQKIKGAFNKVASTTKAIWNWGKDLAQGNLSANLDITETSYEAAQRIKGKLNIEKNYLENPDSFILSENAQKRLIEKRYSAEKVHSELKQEYDLLKDNVPGWFSELVTNIIYKPNADYSESRFYLDNSESSLNLMKNLIKISKYNSAVNLNESILINLNNSLENYESQSRLERKVDWLIVIFWLLILGIVIFLGMKYFKQEKYNKEYSF